MSCLDTFKNLSSLTVSQRFNGSVDRERHDFFVLDLDGNKKPY